MRISAEDELENTRGERFMKRAIWILIMLVLLLGAKPAEAADNRFIVRTTGGLPLIQGVCALLWCNVVHGLDGSLNQLFLVTAPSSIDPTALLAILHSQLGVVAVELDQLVGLGAGLAEASAPPAGLWNSSPVNYYGATVWAGYVNQPAAGIVRVSDTQKAFNVAGAGIVADIDTGVDPNHPALRNVLLLGYDFTRNQPGGSEMRDVPAFAYGGQGQPAQVNQSTAAALDQSTAAVLATTVQYAAFGHGTMVVGIIHLVAPHAVIMPLKAFHSDGTGYVSDILRAIYYAVQNKAKVINMSFDFTAYSKELARSMKDRKSTRLNSRHGS